MMRLTRITIAAGVLVVAGISLFYFSGDAGLGALALQAQEPKRAVADADPFAAPAKAAKGKDDQDEMPPMSGAVTRLQQELNKPTIMEFVETPLKDAVTYLQEQHGIPMVLAGNKLEEAGVSVDTAVTKDLQGVRLSTALDLMLGELDLAYVEQDGILIITTPEEAMSRLETRIYDCRDLLGMPVQAWPKASRTPDDKDPADPSPEPVGAYGAGGSGSGGRARSHDERAGRLMNIITTNVDSASWQQTNGPGAISEFGGLFVVTQTQPTHKEIERVLDMLRTAAGLDVGPRKVVR